MDTELVFKIIGFIVGSGVLAGMIKLVYSCGKVISDINYLKSTMDKDVKTDLQAIRKEVNEATPEIAEIKSKVDILWRDRTSINHSPRALNRRGLELLQRTNIKQIIKKRQAAIVSMVRSEQPSNAYEAEQAVMRVVAALRADPEVKRIIEPKAFESGSSVEEILFVGAIYIRGTVFDALNIKGAS